MLGKEERTEAFSKDLLTLGGRDLFSSWYQGHVVCHSGQGMVEGAGSGACYISDQEAES